MNLVMLRPGQFADVPVLVQLSRTVKEVLAGRQQRCCAVPGAEPHQLGKVSMGEPRPISAEPA